jgi:hypothetical protein
VALKLVGVWGRKLTAGRAAVRGGDEAAGGRAPDRRPQRRGRHPQGPPLHLAPAHHPRRPVRPTPTPPPRDCRAPLCRGGRADVCGGQRAAGDDDADPVRLDGAAPARAPGARRAGAPPRGAQAVQDAPGGGPHGRGARPGRRVGVGRAAGGGGAGGVAAAAALPALRRGPPPRQPLGAVRRLRALLPLGVRAAHPRRHGVQGALLLPAGRLPAARGDARGAAAAGVGVGHARHAPGQLPHQQGAHRLALGPAPRRQGPVGHLPQPRPAPQQLLPVPLQGRLRLPAPRQRRRGACPPPPYAQSRLGSGGA